MKVAPKRLRSAERLWWHIDPENELQNSACSSKEIGPRLVEVIAMVFPELLAHEVDEDWFASGFRVRGHAIGKIPGAGQALLFGPDRAFPELYYQHFMHPPTCLSLERKSCKLTHTIHKNGHSNRSRY